MKMNKIKKSLLIVLILISIMICSCKKDNDEVIPNNPNMSSGENTNNNTDDVIITPKKKINENHVDFKGETLVIICDNVDTTDPRNDNYTFSDKKQRIKELEYIESAYNCKIEYDELYYFSLFDTFGKSYTLPNISFMRALNSMNQTFGEDIRQAYEDNYRLQDEKNYWVGFTGSEYISHNVNDNYNKETFFEVFRELETILTKNIVFHYTPLTIHSSGDLAEWYMPDSSPLVPYVNFNSIDSIKNDNYYKALSSESSTLYHPAATGLYQYPADKLPILPVYYFDTNEINNDKINNYLTNGFSYNNLKEEGLVSYLNILDYHQAINNSKGSFVKSVEDEMGLNLLADEMLTLDLINKDYYQIEYKDIAYDTIDVMKANDHIKDAFLPYTTDINESSILSMTYYTYRMFTSNESYHLRSSELKDSDLFDLMVDLAEGFEHSIDVEFEKYLKYYDKYSACVNYINQVKNLETEFDYFEIFKMHLVYNYFDKKNFLYNHVLYGGHETYNETTPPSYQVPYYQIISLILDFSWVNFEIKEDTYLWFYYSLNPKERLLYLLTCADNLIKEYSKK